MSFIPNTKSNRLLNSNPYPLLNNPEKREKEAYTKKGEIIFQKRKTLISDINFIFCLVIKTFNYEKFYPKETKDFEVEFNGKLNSIINNINNHNNCNGNSNKENFNINVADYNCNNKSPKKLISKEEIFTKKFAYSEIQRLFVDNKIFFDRENYNLITKSKSSEFLLNQVKLWIALIIVLKDKKMNADSKPNNFSTLSGNNSNNNFNNTNNTTYNNNSNKLYDNINFVNKIFENALKRKIDKVFLFEFYLIFLSEQNTLTLLNANFLENKPENFLDNNLNDLENKNEIFIPKDFIAIYAKYRVVLKSLINSDNNNKTEDNEENVFVYNDKNNELVMDTERKQIERNKNFSNNANNSVVSTKNSSMNLVSTKKENNEENEKEYSNNNHNNNKNNNNNNNKLNSITNKDFDVISSSNRKNIKTKILAEDTNKNAENAKYLKKLKFVDANINIENDFKKMLINNNNNIDNNTNVPNINDSFSNNSFYNKKENPKHNNYFLINIDDKFNLESVKSEKAKEKEAACLTSNAIKNQNLLLVNNFDSKEQQKHLLLSNNNFNLNNSDSLNLNFNHIKNLMNNSDFVPMNKNEFSFFTKDKTEDSQFFLKCDKIINLENLDSDILNTNVKNSIEDEISSGIKQSAETQKTCNISKLNISEFNNFGGNLSLKAKDNINYYNEDSFDNNNNNICNFNESVNLISKLSEKNSNYQNENNDKETAHRELSCVKDLDKKSEEKLRKIKINVNELNEDEELLNPNLIGEKTDVLSDKGDLFSESNLSSKNSKGKNKQNQFMKNLDFNNYEAFNNNFFLMEVNKEQEEDKFFAQYGDMKKVNHAEKLDETNCNFIFRSPDKKPKKLILYKEAEESNAHKIPEDDAEETLIKEENFSYKNPFAIKLNKAHDSKKSNNINLADSVRKKSDFYSDSKSFLNLFNKKLNLYLNKENKINKKPTSISVSEPSIKNNLVCLEAEKANLILSKEFQINKELENELRVNLECNSNNNENECYTKPTENEKILNNNNNSEIKKLNFDSQTKGSYMSMEETKKDDLAFKRVNKQGLLGSKDKNLFLLEGIKIESPLNLLDDLNFEIAKANENQISEFTEEAKETPNHEAPNPKSPTLSSYLIPTNKSNSDLSNDENVKNKFFEKSNRDNNEKFGIANYRTSNDDKNIKLNRRCFKNKKLNNSDEYSEKKHTAKKNSIRKSYEFSLLPIKKFCEFNEEESNVNNEKSNFSAINNQINSCNNSSANHKNINNNINFSFNYNNLNKPYLNFSNSNNSISKHAEFTDESLLTPEKSVISNLSVKPYQDYRDSIKSNKVIDISEICKRIKNKNADARTNEKAEAFLPVNAFSLANSIEFSITNDAKNKKKIKSDKAEIVTNISLEIKANAGNKKEKIENAVSINSGSLCISANQSNLIASKNKNHNLTEDKNNEKLNISSSHLEIKNNNKNITEQDSKEEQQSEDLDYKPYLKPENFDVVEKNYLNNNNFCVLELKSILKIILKCEFAILPLKDCGSSGSERLNMLSDLYFLRNSDYSDFCFLPFNEEIIALLGSS